MSISKDDVDALVAFLPSLTEDYDDSWIRSDGIVRGQVSVLK
jgi:hypothetical protein